MSKKNRRDQLKKGEQKPSDFQWFLEVADTYDQTEPNKQLTGMLATESEAREKASELEKIMGPFEKIYVVGPGDRRYSWQ